LKAAKVDKARGAVVAVTLADEAVAFVTTDGAVMVPSGSVRQAARDGGGSKVNGVEGQLLRVVAVSEPPEPS
jgi:hypothetical protein